MKKSDLLKKITASLKAHLAMLEKAARESRAEATHESSKAENKYDTRGLEAAYLAGGQARQVREIADAITMFEGMEPKNFAADEPIDLGALVEVEMDGASSLFFIGPKNGGLEIEYQKKEITVITPPSPLGQNLIGKKTGDSWASGAGKSAVKHRVVSVC
jgi:transcription elongation GreA/GreB family factor